VFSGRVVEGQRLHVLSSAYNPARPGEGQRRVGVVRAAYLMMGTGLERLATVPAGNVLALEGFEDAILKTATLSSTPACPPMAAMTFQVPTTTPFELP
jgi:ribosome assembly protein 1